MARSYLGTKTQQEDRLAGSLPDMITRSHIVIEEAPALEVLSHHAQQATIAKISCSLLSPDLAIKATTA